MTKAEDLRCNVAWIYLKWNIKRNVKFHWLVRWYYDIEKILLLRSQIDRSFSLSKHAELFQYQREEQSIAIKF